jgi:outer membrane protein insertion porin family
MREIMNKFVYGAVTAVLFLPFAVIAQIVTDLDDVTELETLNPNLIARLSGRVAYSSDFGAMAGVGFATDRLMGHDQALVFNIEARETGAIVSLSYGNDAIFGTSPAFGLNLLRSESRAGKVYDFDSTVTRVEPHLTWELSPALSASAYAYHSWNEIENVPTTTSALIVVDEGEETTTALGIKFDYQIPVKPDSVMHIARLRFGAEVGSSTLDNDFVRVTASGQTAHAFNDGNVVLRSQVRLGATSNQSGNSNIGDRYMLGQGSIRGFEFGGFGPRDLEVASTPALGGNYYGVAKFDIQFPNVFGGRAERLTPGVFADLGSLWGLGDVAGGVAGEDMVDDASYLRASVGVSLRIETGMGAVQMYAAHPFATEAYDQTQNFGIELSQSF